jgi:hypothetical protein
MARAGLLWAMHFHHFRLSFANHVRYKYVLTVFAIPTLSSAHRIGIGRMSDDL